MTSRFFLARVTKKATGLVKAIQAREVEIAAVHHVERARLGDQEVEDVDIVQFAVGNVDETGNIAAKIEQRVQLDRPLGGAKRAHGNSARHRSMVVESNA